MVKRRRSEDERISLFPFLSIVICVIGFLTVMLTSEAIGKMASKPDVAAVARTEEFRALNARLAEVKKLAKERDESDLGTVFREMIAKSEAELAELEKKKNERDQATSAVNTEAAKLQAEIERLKSRLAQLETEVTDRSKVEADLKKEVEEKKSPPPAPVAIRPGGTGKNLKPFFIECTDTSIILHSLRDAKPIRAADIASHADFLGVLTEAAGAENGTVVFLLRDNGLGTYAVAQSVAASQGVRNGKLPVMGKGRIDLSAFRRLLGKDKS